VARRLLVVDTTSRHNAHKHRVNQRFNEEWCREHETFMKLCPKFHRVVRRVHRKQGCWWPHFLGLRTRCALVQPTHLGAAWRNTVHYRWCGDFDTSCGNKKVICVCPEVPIVNYDRVRQHGPLTTLVLPPHNQRTENVKIGQATTTAYKTEDLLFFLRHCRHH
jgi:hypothetical protein